MIIWGQMMGFNGDLNVYFRVVKVVLPMLLFYSIPRLFVRQDIYDMFFRLIFLVLIMAFVAQLFTLLSGISPMEAVGRTDEIPADEKEFRVFFQRKQHPPSFVRGHCFI